MKFLKFSVFILTILCFLSTGITFYLSNVRENEKVKRIHLEEVRSQLEEQIKGLESEKADLESKVSELNTTNEGLLKQIQELQAAKQSAEESNRQKDLEIGNQTNQIQKSEKALKDAEKRNRDLGDTVSDLESRIKLMQVQAQQNQNTRDSSAQSSDADLATPKVESVLKSTTIKFIPDEEVSVDSAVKGNDKAAKDEKKSDAVKTDTKSAIEYVGEKSQIEDREAKAAQAEKSNADQANEFKKMTDKARKEEAEKEEKRRKNEQKLAEKQRNEEKKLEAKNRKQERKLEKKRINERKKLEEQRRKEAEKKEQEKHAEEKKAAVSEKPKKHGFFSFLKFHKQDNSSSKPAEVTPKTVKSEKNVTDQTIIPSTTKKTVAVVTPSYQSQPTPSRREEKPGVQPSVPAPQAPSERESSMTKTPFMKRLGAMNDGKTMPTIGASSSPQASIPVTTTGSAMFAAKSSIESQAIAGEGQTKGVMASKEPSASTLDKSESGKVMLVNRKFNFVVVNLGSRSGLAVNSMVSIRKGNSEVAKARVEKLYDDYSAAYLTEEQSEAAIGEGDAVVPVS